VIGGYFFKAAAKINVFVKSDALLEKKKIGRGGMVERLQSWGLFRKNG